MNKNVKPVPDGYHTVTPYIIVKDAAKALDFYKKAIGAEEIFRIDTDGKIGHAEMQIGNSRIMMADEFPEMQALSPASCKGTSVSFMIYVNDVDSAAKIALAAGMTIKKPVENQFYGDR